MYYKPQGNGGLRTATSGLLMTCGLFHAGPVDSKQYDLTYGMHRRAHHLPAHNVNVREHWIQDELHWEVQGVVKETSIFGQKLRLTRTYSGIIGTNSISNQDEIENIGFHPAKHMMPYHFNFGYPLLDSNTKITIPDCQSEVCGGWEYVLDEIKSWSDPNSEIKEKVFYHHSFNQVNQDENMVSVSIH